MATVASKVSWYWRCGDCRAGGMADSLNLVSVALATHSARDHKTPAGKIHLHGRKWGLMHWYLVDGLRLTNDRARAEASSGRGPWAGG